VFFTGSSGCYEEKHPKDKKKTAVSEDLERLVVRKGIRFPKTEQMHKTVVVLIINVCFVGRGCLIQ
jgi:hypothetical protein